MTDEETTSPSRQAAAVLRVSAGASAIAAALALAGTLSRGAESETLFSYQTCSALVSGIIFILTFESHFHGYWHLEAVVFFSALLLAWGAIGAVANDPIPFIALIVTIPVVTVLLPWSWQFQLGICTLCVASMALAIPLLPSVQQARLLWITIAAESAVSLSATIQLERQRKRQQVFLEALAADEEQFRALIENSPDGLSVVNGAGGIVFQSPSAERLMGYIEKLLGRSAYEFVHQDDAPKLRDLIAKCLANPDLIEGVALRYRHADGSWRTIEGTGKYLRNYGDEPLVVLNWRDVTERVSQELRIRESEEMFRKIFHYSTNIISIASLTDGRYIDVNDEFLRVSGYTRAEVIGKTPLDLGLWPDPESYIRLVTEFLMRGEIRNHKTEFRMKDGSIVSGLFSAVKLDAGSNNLSLGIVSILPPRGPDV